MLKRNAVGDVQPGANLRLGNTEVRVCKVLFSFGTSDTISGFLATSVKVTADGRAMVGSEQYYLPTHLLSRL